MPTTAVSVRTNGEVSEFLLEPETSYESITAVIGRPIDAVTITAPLGQEKHHEQGVVVYCHDEGLLIGLKPNVVASMLCQRPIVGDVVLVGLYDENGYADGENHDVPRVYTSKEFATMAQFANNDEGAVRAILEMIADMGF